MSVVPAMLRALPRRVRVLEVGPRDGLQNQPARIPVEIKAEWIARLARSGLEEIEVTSFVRPDRVPQLADAAELMARLPRDGRMLYSVLVPNLEGLENALASGARRIALFIAASETFSRKNTNCSIAESLVRCREVFERLGGESVHVRVYISTAFGCPYEGAVPAGKVADLARALHELGAAEIAVSDTIGVATPPLVVEVVEEVKRGIPLEATALHFHDTRGLALANVLVALDHGVGRFDASAGGLGGCPFAPGASGNLATEDLVHLLDSLGIETGVDLERLAEASLWLERHLAAPLPGRMLGALRSRRPASGPDRK